MVRETLLLRHLCPERPLPFRGRTACCTRRPRSARQGTTAGAVGKRLPTAIKRRAAVSRSTGRAGLDGGRPRTGLGQGAGARRTAGNRSQRGPALSPRRDALAINNSQAQSGKAATPGRGQGRGRRGRTGAGAGSAGGRHLRLYGHLASVPPLGSPAATRKQPLAKRQWTGMAVCQPCFICKNRSGWVWPVGSDWLTPGLERPRAGRTLLLFFIS